MSKSFDTNSSLMESIFFSFRNSRFAEQLEGRRLFPTRAIVTNNQDPESRRRIKVADPSMGGIIESNWVNPLRHTQNFDPPMPQVHQSVLILYADGDPEDAFYLPLVSDPNPTKVKDDPELDESYQIEGSRNTQIDLDETLTVEGDRTSEIAGNDTLKIEGDASTTISGNESLTVEGDRTSEIAGNEQRTVSQNYVIECGSSFTLTTASGCSFTLTPSGHIVLQDASGRKITLGGTGISSHWDLAGGVLDIVNVGDVRIDGKSVLVLGAKDTDNDTIVYRGY